jgi:hypothetical protein
MRVSQHSCCPLVSTRTWKTSIPTDHYSRVLDFLDGGIASSSRIDGLGKGIAEYLRSKVVEIPIRFLQRGCI